MNPPENIPATDNDRDLDTQLVDIGDLFCDPLQCGRVDPISLGPVEGLAANFQEYPFIAGAGIRGVGVGRVRHDD